MNNHAERLRKLCEAASTLPAGEWTWKKNYELGDGECHWAISTPESAKEGRVLDIHTVLWCGPYEAPPDYGPPKPSPIMRLWTDAANSRATLALAARIMEASKELSRAAKHLISEASDSGHGYPELDMEPLENLMTAQAAFELLWREWASDTGTREDES